jgi:mannan endo-1,4-beta-mannosidase
MNRHEHSTTKTRHRRGVARLLLAGTAALGLALAATGTAQAASPTPNPACQVTYTVAAQFANHFEALIAVRNTGTTTVNSWRLTWTFADGQVITNPWGANVAQVGADVTATSLPWDSVIQPGSWVSSIGFYATWNNVTNSIPRVACETS